MLLDVHQEYNQLLGDDERGRGDNWFDDVHIQVCSFNRKVHCWLRKAAQRAKSWKCSSRSSSVSDKGSMNWKKSKDSLEPRSSRAFRETRSSKSSRDRDREREKMKVVQLIAAAELWQQKQIIQNEAGKLKIKEKLTKAKNSSMQQHRARTTSCTWIRDWHFWWQSNGYSLLYGGLRRGSGK